MGDSRPQSTARHGPHSGRRGQTNRPCLKPKGTQTSQHISGGDPDKGTAFDIKVCLRNDRGRPVLVMLTVFHLEKSPTPFRYPFDLDDARRLIDDVFAINERVQIIMGEVGLDVTDELMQQVAAMLIQQFNALVDEYETV